MRRAAGPLLALAIVAGALSGAYADQDQQVAVRVEPGGLARAGVEAAWSASYDTFDWAEIRAEDLSRLKGAGVAAEPRPDAGVLVLPGRTFDPLRNPPASPDLGPAETSLHLVQLRGPTKGAWLDEIRARGVVLVQYVAPFSYVVLADAAAIDAVSALPFVRWAGPFTPGDRFGNLEAGIGNAVNAVVLDDGRAGAAIGALRRLGSEVRVTDRFALGDAEAIGLTLSADPAGLAELTAIPTLYSLAPELRGEARGEMSSQINAGNYTEAGVPDPGYTDWLAAKGLDGTGVIVAHVDDGYGTSHPDAVGTVHGCHNYAVPGGACSEHTGTGSDFHGQHTGGIIVGTGTVPTEATDDFRHGQGVAPGAKLFVQNYIALEAFFGYSGAGQYQRLNRDSVLGGATISANSWGPSGTPRGYDAATREFDHAPRDANLDTPEHEPLAFVLSIMNGRGGTSTQGTPDEGKNILRVGASKNHRAGNIGDLSYATAHGPALDGRRLPDIVAPGESVIAPGNPVTIGFCAGGQVDPLVSAWAALYASCTGTSMASPHVSGSSALFTEWFRKRSDADPSPALQKAALVNGAVNLAGRRDANNGVLGNIPDNKQGWGRVNLENVFGRTEKDHLDQEVLFTETGQAWSATIEPVDPSQPVKVTLVWTDAPGHGMGGSTPAWVNDLDLRVTEGEDEDAVTYLGNAFGSPSTGWSVPGGTADDRNNIENVYLQDVTGPLTVQVIAANLAGDGVPGNEHDTDQDFALWVSNGRLVLD